MEEFTWELVLGEQEGLERKELKTQGGGRESEVGVRSRSLSRQKSRGCGMVPFPFSSLLLPSLMAPRLRGSCESV